MLLSWKSECGEPGGAARAYFFPKSPPSSPPSPPSFFLPSSGFSSGLSGRSTSMCLQGHAGHRRRNWKERRALGGPGFRCPQFAGNCLRRQFRFFGHVADGSRAGHEADEAQSVCRRLPADHPGRSSLVEDAEVANQWRQLPPVSGRADDSVRPDARAALQVDS